MSAHFRPSVEPLERRDTPAFTSALSGLEAELLGDNAADTFVLSASGGLLQHNRAGDPGFASGSDWDTTKAGVQTLGATSAAVVRFLDLGGGDDAVQLGEFLLPAFNVKAAVVIVTGGAGTDRLTVRSSSEDSARTYAVDRIGVQSTGVNVTTLTPLEGGITIGTGSGPDTVNVAATAGPLTVDGNGGSDRVNFGRLGELGGIVRLTNNGGPDDRTAVTIDDRENVGNSSLGIVDGPGDDTLVQPRVDRGIQFDADEVSSLIFRGGPGIDSINYQATRGVPTALLGGDGADLLVVTVPPGATGDLGLVGEGGGDSFVVDRPLPSGFVLNANGSPNTGLDVLSVVAGTTTSVTHASATEGTVQAAPGEAVTTFRNMRQVYVNGSVQSLIVNLPPAAADRTLDLGEDGGANDPDGRSRGGESILTGSSLTPTQFDNPAVSLVVNLGDSGYTVRMAAMDAFYAPAGNGLQPGGTFLRGGTAADTFFVTPDFDSVTTVAGGDPTTAPGDTLFVNREYPNPTAATPAGTLGTGPGSLTYTGIETLDLEFSDAYFVAGLDRGGPPTVARYNNAREETFRGAVFPSTVTGGVRVASGDFNGDGVPDTVVGTGPGGPTRVRILDDNTQEEIFAVDPFEASFTGGVYVAAGDLDGDGQPELIITPDEGGGPRVRVFDGDDFAVRADFFGIDDPNFRGGARAAVGDIDGDGFGDLVVAAGFGGGPRVAAFKGSAAFANDGPKLFGDFFVFEQTLRNGAFIAVGDVNADGKADLVGGGGPGGGPRVLIFSGADLVANKADQSAVLGNFFAGDPASRGGVRVATVYLDRDAPMDLLAGSGTAAGARVTGYLGRNIAPTGLPPAEFDLDAFPGFFNGVFVG